MWSNYVIMFPYLCRILSPAFPISWSWLQYATYFQILHVADLNNVYFFLVFWRKLQISKNDVTCGKGSFVNVINRVGNYYVHLLNWWGFNNEDRRQKLLQGEVQTPYGSDKRVQRKKQLRNEQLIYCQNIVKKECRFLYHLKSKT